MTKLRSGRRRFLIGVTLLAASGLPHAAGYPSGTIRILYNFAAGGPGDAALRYLADQLAPRLGQQVIVENRTGGSGSIGILGAARSAPDGYTLLFTTLPGVIQLPYFADKNFDPVKSLQPLALIGSSPLVILAHPSVPPSDFPGFVEWAKAQPSSTQFAGAGPIIELAIARLGRETGLKLEFIPYRGSAPAVQAVVGGEVKFYFMPPSAMTTEFVKLGKLKVIGTTSAEPSPLVPGGQPIAKTVPGYVQTVDYCLWAPAGAPPEVLAALGPALKEILARPATAEKLLSFGIEPRNGGPEDVAALTVRETENIRRILATTPIKFGQ